MPPVLKDGKPRKAFAYAPTNDPSTWKLPFLTASGAPDPDHLPGAAAAMSEGGFRGQKADIPADARAAVKSKLKAAYRRWKGSDVELPDGLKEVAVTFEGGYSIREATILLDKAPTSATVIGAPNGDVYVIPCWTGAFADLTKPLETYAPDTNWSAAWDAEQAADILGDLVKLKRGESDEPEQAAMLDTAIGAVANFFRAEAATIGTTETVNPMVAEAVAFLADPDGIELTESAIAGLREVGKRNSGRDQTRIQAAHDVLHDLGATHTKGKTYAGMQESAAPPPVEVVRDNVGSPAPFRFREASGPEELVTLAEAKPIWDAEERTVWVTPIKPGWGNSRDKNYYPAATLKEAVSSGRFDHIKMYMDHPTSDDEKKRPERSVKDWFATTREAKWDDVAQEPRVPIKVHDKATFDRFQEAPEQIAFSVLGGGVGRPGEVAGQRGRIVESITNLRSLDWVTEAGAGGQLAFAESAGNDEEMDTMGDEIKDMTVAQLDSLKESNPELYGHIMALAKTATTTPAPAAAPAAAPVAEAEEPKWAKDLRETIAADQTARSAAQAATAAAQTKTAASGKVAEVVGATTLIKPAKDAIIAQFAEASYGEGTPYADEAKLVEAVQGSIKVAEATIKPFAGKSRVDTGAAGAISEGAGGTEDTAIKEAVVANLEKRFSSGSTLPSKPRLVYTADEVAGMAQNGTLAPEDGSMSAGAKAAAAALAAG